MENPGMTDNDPAADAAPTVEQERWQDVPLPTPLDLAASLVMYRDNELAKMFTIFFCLAAEQYPEQMRAALGKFIGATDVNAALDRIEKAVNKMNERLYYIQSEHRRLDTEMSRREADLLAAKTEFQDLRQRCITMNRWLNERSNTIAETEAKLIALLRKHGPR